MRSILIVALTVAAPAWPATMQHDIHVSPNGQITDGHSDPCGNPASFTPNFARVPQRSRARVMRFYHDVTMIHRNEVDAIERNQEADLAANRSRNAVTYDPAGDARRDQIRRERQSALERSRKVYDQMRSAFIASLPAADQEGARWVLADWIFTCPAKPARR